MFYLCYYCYSNCLLKVVGAKVVTSAKAPGSKCFGFVTMSSVHEAEQAIESLSNTEIAEGQKITVEKVCLLTYLMTLTFQSSLWFFIFLSGFCVVYYSQVFEW